MPSENERKNMVFIILCSRVKSLALAVNVKWRGNGGGVLPVFQGIKVKLPTIAGKYGFG